MALPKSGGVRREDHVGQRPERIVGGQWLTVKDVERCAAEMAGAKRVGQGLVIDDSARGRR